jgi:hypothetical protein
MRDAARGNVRALARKHVQSSGGCVDALRRRQSPQPSRLHKALRDALALVAEDAEVVLRDGIALRGQEPIQPRGLDVVARDALALGVAAAEVALRDRVALRRREPIQTHRRLHVVLHHALAVGVDS